MKPLRTVGAAGTALVVAALILGGCDAVTPSLPDDSDVLAGPLEGLSGAQMASHLKGDAGFARVFSPAEGLGPLFVAASCESCHVADGKGHDVTTLTRFGQFRGGRFDPMREAGGPQLQHRAVAGYEAERIPREATGVTRLMAPAVTGLGFLEAVPDDVLLELADPLDADGDGVSGRPGWIELPPWVSPGPAARENNGRYIGRFGKKSAARDLVHQTANAYSQDMGLTTEFLPRDLTNPVVGMDTGDIAPDPEIQSDEFQSVVFYIRTLKEPPRRNEDDPQVQRGERIFAEALCTACHVPTLRTGPSAIESLDRVTFAPYTDLLLHDMGPELDDGYAEGGALTSEWRTAPLWGIGLAADSQGGEARYLHDGRAATLEEAILLHGGEAARSREAYNRLSAADRDALIAFLESL
ncbi:MAG: c-type cytochrome [Rhodothermales bacterium]|nr:c-type cytochrome [Rhodothermales bacterium]